MSSHHQVSLLLLHSAYFAVPTLGCCVVVVTKATQAATPTSGRGRLRFEDASLHQSAADEPIHQLLELFLPWLAARLLTGTCSWVTGGNKWTYYTAASAQIYIRVSRALFHPWLCISVTDYLIHVFLHPPSLYLSQAFYLLFLLLFYTVQNVCVGWKGGWVAGWPGVPYTAVT